MRRALILGSQTASLQGVDGDVASVTKSFAATGFTIDSRTGGDATYDGMIDGFNRLIDTHRPEHAALIYYSGHGGRAPGPDGRILQFLVPTDYQRPDGRFRGLFDFEISALLARLTAAGPNVSVILDCCHAGMMARDAGTLRARALPRLWVEGVEQRLAELAPALAALAPEGNPYAVRLAASEPALSAYEAERPDGTSGGIMTGALLDTLSECGPDLSAITWAALGARVRERVMARVPEQRPVVEGPARRHLFSTDEAGDAGAVTFFHDGGRPSLRAGRLLGATTGATYAIMPFGTSAYRADQVAASALVTAVDGPTARLALTPPDAVVADGALAFRLSAPFEKRSVLAIGPAAGIIADSAWVKPVADNPGIIAELRIEQGRLTVLDKAQAALTQVPDDEAGRQRARAVLEQLARADAAKALPPGGLPDALEIEWGRVVDAAPVLMQQGDTLHAGDRFYLKARNTGPTPVHLAVLDIGITGSITLLTTLQPTGMWLPPGQTHTVGAGAGPLRGLLLRWPDGVPTDGTRAESFLVIAAEEPTDFRALEGKAARGDFDGSDSGLTALLRQVGSAGRRDMGPDEPEGGRYLAKTVEFQLSPQPRASQERRASFAVDQSLAPAYLSRGDIDLAAPPAGEIAIRFKRLVVHANRALWSTDIRVDTLVAAGFTTPPDTPPAPFLPGTQVFPRISDDDALPFDDLLVYVGRPHRYIDLSIWVSKDSGKSKPLSELLKDAVNDGEFQAAATTLAGLALSGPAAITLVAAAAAAGTVGFFAARLLSAAVGSSIGLYRTSFLPPAFGLGLHPKIGMIRAQDFSLAFEIVEVPA